MTQPESHGDPRFSCDQHRLRSLELLGQDSLSHPSTTVGGTPEHTMAGCGQRIGGLR